MWWRRDMGAHMALNKGASFRRVGPPGTVETATVIAVVSDGAGISHVQFSLEFPEFGEGAVERRTLSMDRFCALYGEPAAA